ncbi:hypothetical protein N0V84_011013 [Fusarium piperis]|uniref:Uncharacterized protein n=1 Tax=Fusarium piperis TaxID=1435070 RepID=A0A9W8TEN5_9HYPO|nr:hypothetical protein N0V84_011013 [Fusarium piperis]
MALTVGQAIGVGVAVGFVSSLILTAVVWCISQHTSKPRTGFVATKVLDKPSPPQLLQPQLMEDNPFNNWIGDSHTRAFQLRSARELEEVTPSPWTLISWCKSFFGGLGRQPDVPESLFDESELVRLAGKPVNGGTWSQSIGNISTRVPAMACFLAQVMFKRMQPTCPVHECLLPPEISSCYQLLCRVYENPRRARTVAVWRESVFVLQEDPWSLLPIPCGTFKEGDPRKERIRAMIPAIINALQPEALRTDQPRDDRLEDYMADIFETAANSAVVLLGQRSEWEAVWSSTKPGFIIFPGLRFVWGGETKASRPAEVDDKLVWPVRPDDQDQPKSRADQQPSSDTAEAPTHDALQLHEHKAAGHGNAEHSTAEHGTAEHGTAAYSATDY